MLASILAKLGKQSLPCRYFYKMHKLPDAREVAATP